jgi:hypothetical protein
VVNTSNLYLNNLQLDITDSYRHSKPDSWKQQRSKLQLCMPKHRPTPTARSSHPATTSLRTKLYKWNSALGVNGANCSSEFWVNTYYCIGIVIPSHTRARSIPANCNLYGEALTGD